jgi:hypothetical protein
MGGWHGCVTKQVMSALRQLAVVRGRRVKHNDLGARTGSLTNVLRIFPISRSGTAMTTRRRTKSPDLLHAFDPQRRLETRTPFCRHLDMIHVEQGVLEVGRQAHAHLSAGAQQCDFGHVVAPQVVARPARTDPKKSAFPICPPFSPISIPFTFGSVEKTRQSGAPGAIRAVASSA